MEKLLYANYFNEEILMGIDHDLADQIHDALDELPLAASAQEIVAALYPDLDTGDEGPPEGTAHEFVRMLQEGRDQFVSQIKDFIDQAEVYLASEQAHLDASNIVQCEKTIATFREFVAQLETTQNTPGVFVIPLPNSRPDPDGLTLQEAYQVLTENLPNAFTVAPEI